MATLAELIVRIGADARAFERDIAKVENKIKRLGSQFKDIGSRLTTGLTLPITALGGGALKAAIDFESAFAGVRKTVDATEGELAALREGILAMAREVPAAQTEIAAVAEAAGQLGIQTDAILGFTRTMIDMGVATNLSADQAATALARLANITQMPQDQFDRLGSTIVALGNNLATTEAEIVEMGLRLAGAGHQVGLTEAQILSFAGALSSVGIEAEAGGSAFSRVMVNIANEVAKGGEKLQLFASVAGMTAAEFAETWRRDAAGALIAFIEGLGRLSQQGGNTFEVLEALGLSEIRVRDALLRAAGAGDLFRQSLEIGTRAWEENIALTREAEQRYATTESKLQLLRNRLVEAGITLGDALAPALREAIDATGPLIDRLRQLAEWFANLPQPTQQTIIQVAALTAAMGPLMFAVGTTIQAFSGLLGVIRALSGGTGIAGLIALGQKLSNAFMLWRTGALGFGAALRLVLGPVGLVITALGLLVTAGAYVYRNWDTIKERAGQLWDYLRAGFDGLVSRVSYAWNRIVEAIWGAVARILDAVEPVTRFLPESWQQAFRDMRASVEQNMEAAASRADEAAARIASATTRMALAFRDAGAVAQDNLSILDARHAAVTRAVAERSPQVAAATGQVSAALAGLGNEAEKAGRKVKDQLAEALTALDHRIQIVRDSLELYRLQNNLAEDSAEFLKEQLKAQRAEFDLLGQKIVAVEEALERVAAAKGLNSEAALELQAKLSGLRLEQEKLKKAIDETTKALQEQSRAAGMPEGSLSLLQKAIDQAGGFENLVRRTVEKAGQFGIDPIKAIQGIYSGLGIQAPDRATAERIARQAGIPGFAEGGIVTRPTLALIGERGPEAVVPLSRGRAPAGFGPITINIYGSVGVDDIADRLVRELQRRTAIR